MTFFIELEQMILKFVWSHKRPRIAEAILKKKFEAGGISLSDFRQYYKATVIKMAWCWHKNRPVDPRNRIESSEINPETYSQLIVDKGGKNAQWGKVYSKWHWESWRATCKSVKLGDTVTAYPKINSERLKDTDIRHDTIQLLEESAGKAFSDTNCTDVFLGRPVSQGNRTKNKHKQMRPNYYVIILL